MKRAQVETHTQYRVLLNELRSPWPTGAPLSLNHQDGDSTQSRPRKKRLLGFACPSLSLWGWPLSLAINRTMSMHLRFRDDPGCQATQLRAQGQGPGWLETTLPWPHPGQAGWKGARETSDRPVGAGGSWAPAVTSQVRVAHGSGHCLWGGSFSDRKRPSGEPQAVKRCKPLQTGRWETICRRKHRLGPCDGPSHPEGISCCTPTSRNL